MSNSGKNHSEAILLLGPSGSGKTPLGELIERLGLWGRRCRHFDFGAQLRRVGSGKDSKTLSPEETGVVREVLRTGALLEDSQFPIARKILSAFLDGDGDSLIILNGLPRHVGQAVGIEATVRVSAVVELVCSADVAVGRIASNAGGDRTGRADDDIESVRRRLTVYQERTALLVDHYRQLGRKIELLPVGVETSAQDAWEELNGRDRS